MLQNLEFWTLLVGLILFVVKFFFPAFPFDETQVLAFVLFLLGLVGIYPQLMQRKLLGVTAGDLFKSKAFWTLVSGFGVFLIHQFLPAFPIDQAMLMGVILFVLARFGITPELMKRGLL